LASRAAGVRAWAKVVRWARRGCNRAASLAARVGRAGGAAGRERGAPAGAVEVAGGWAKTTDLALAVARSRVAVYRGRRARGRARPNSRPSPALAAARPRPPDADHLSMPHHALLTLMQGASRGGESARAAVEGSGSGASGPRALVRARSARLTDSRRRMAATRLMMSAGCIEGEWAPDGGRARPRRGGREHGERGMRAAESPMAARRRCPRRACTRAPPPPMRHAQILTLKEVGGGGGGGGGWRRWVGSEESCGGCLPPALI